MLNVSTKTGDKGHSSLADGSRLPKDVLVFEVIGTIDELNSHLGVVIAIMKKEEHKELNEQLAFLEQIQHEMFILGGEVAGAKVTVSKSFLAKIERRSEKLQGMMKKNWHHQFVMPGGHEIAAKLDVARAVSRRLERRIVALKAQRKLSPRILKMVNRLSDYLYVLRCFVNQTLGEQEKYFIR